MISTANGDLDIYLTLISHYFSTKPDQPAQLDPTTCYRPEYVQLWKSHQEHLDSWTKLLATFQKLPNIEYLRDMQYESNHCYKALLQLNNNSDSSTIGIIVVLSFIGNLIGFYFSESWYGTSIDGKELTYVPIKAPYNIVSDCSYTPINSEQIQTLPLILTAINDYFPNFIQFNNKFADYKISQMMTGNGFFHNIDLFQVIFTSNIHGIL